MKTPNCSCELLKQILHQTQSTGQGNDLVLLTSKFNRLILKFYLKEQTPSERLRDLKQAKVYFEYTKKNRPFLAIFSR